MSGVGKHSLTDFHDLPHGYYRVLFTMMDIPEGDEHDDYYDLFQHTDEGWLCYNGHGEWGKMSESKLSQDVDKGIRQAPEAIGEKEAARLVELADQD